MKRDFYTVIPAGGSGTRLWPLSRSNRPKFLLPLIGDQSLLQLTAERVAPFSPPDRIYTVSGSAHVGAIARQLPDVPEENLIIEPAMRGTGSAIALAAMLIAQRDPNAIMGSFAADHNINELEQFGNALSTAIAAADQGYLTTIGIEPARPETGYGYIERTDEEVLPGAYLAVRFVEKPDLPTAEAFMLSGHYLWNASMFVWRVDAFVEAFTLAQPQLAETLADIAANWHDSERQEEVETSWRTLPVTTIDQGLMEHVDRFVVVPVDMGWSDIGDWNGFAELIPADDDGNCFTTSVMHQGATNCVVWSRRERMIALVGVDNLAVIDLEDALLIVERSRAQEVRSIVGRLESNRPDLL